MLDEIDKRLLDALQKNAHLTAQELGDMLNLSASQAGRRRQKLESVDTEIRSLGAAVIVLAAALYPYVYLLARTAFREQPASAEEVAMSLGSNAFQRFWRIGLPLARPGRKGLMEKRALYASK